MDEAGASGLRDDRNVCQLCGALENLSLCGGCRDTWYCSKDHQRAHWKQHKRKCKGRQQPKLKETASNSAREGVSTSASSDQQEATPEEPSVKLTTVPRPESKDRLTSEEYSTELQAYKSAAATTASAAEAPKESEHEETGLKTTDRSPEAVTPATSKSSTVRRKEAAGQLPVACQEGSGERYFLDARPFSQTLQSSKHTHRARRSASAMSPQGDTLDTKDTYLDILKSRFSVIAQYVVKCLNTYGICVIDGFLGEVTGQEILTEVKQLQDLGVMHQGQLVQSPSASSDNVDIRGDIITWVDGRGRACENIQFLVSCMDAVVQNCSSLMKGYTINERTKVLIWFFLPLKKAEKSPIYSNYCECGLSRFFNLSRISHEAISFLFFPFRLSLKNIFLYF